MPVQHDLIKDLDFSQEDVSQRRAADPKLNRLLEDYDAIDAEVLQAESTGTLSDDGLKKLKEHRLLTKDKIVQRLSYPE